MTRSILAGLMILGLCVPGRADEAATTYSASAGAGYEALDVRGTKGRVMQYDGKMYHTGRGDLQFSADGAKGLLDFAAHDLGSLEENGKLNLDYRDTVRLSGYFDIMHHRQPFVRTGPIVNGQFTENQFIQDLGPADDMLFKRLVGDIKLALHSAGNWARFFDLEYWSVRKTGNQSAKYLVSSTAPGNTDKLNSANQALVDNLTQDVSVGLGTNLGQNGAVANDATVRYFTDQATPVPIPLATGKPFDSTKQLLPTQHVYSDEVKLRYDLAKNLALTGVFNGRERQNVFNGYTSRSYLANLATTYRASKDLSLTARLYGRYFQVNENQNFVDVNGGQGEGSQIDENALKAELSGNYKAHEKVRVKANYKMELTHRRDAGAENLTTSRTTYFDGVVTGVNTQFNAAAKEDTKHTLNVGVTAELPLDAEVEAGYRKMVANRAAFEGLPTDSDDASLSFMLPLPKNVSFTAGAEYLKERNRSSTVSAFKQISQILRAGLDWQATNKISVGADYTRDYTKYLTEGWFGTADTITSGGRTTILTGTNIHEGGMTNRQKNDTAGAHARVVLPKGFLAMGNASYTRSLGQVGVTQFTPNTLTPVLDNTGTPITVPYSAGWTPAGTTVTDLASSDVRIWRGGVSLSYTPEKFKHLTARAGYRVDDWVDRVDSRNSGRASISSVNVSAKF